MMVLALKNGPIATRSARGLSCSTAPTRKATTTPPRSSAAPTTARSASSASSGTGTPTFEQLRSCNGAKHCVQAFVEAHHPHLLRVYDGGALATAIDDVRLRLRESVPH